MKAGVAASVDSESGPRALADEPASRAVTRADLVVPLALVVASFVLGALANPVGDLPINDDWSYSAAVRELLAQGSLRYTDWTSMPLLPQVLIGAFFGALFGPSETVLRISTLVVNSGGLVALYFAAREVGARPLRAGLLAACVLVNPVFFSLSLSFMTDAHFFAIVAATCWAWLHFARTERRASYLLGLGLAVAATLQRQLGLVLPLAFAFAWLVTRGRARRDLRIALVPVFVVALVHLAYGVCVDRLIGRPALWSAKTEHLISVLTHPGFAIPRDVLARVVATAGYTGLSLAPLLLPARLPALTSRGRLVAGAFLAALALYVAFLTPPFDSLIHPSGVGLRLAPAEPSAGFVLVWRASIFVGVLLVIPSLDAGLRALLRAVRGWTSEPKAQWFPAAFLLGFCLVTLAPLLPILFFDRYLLGVLPLFGILVAALGHEPELESERPRLVDAVFVLSLAFVSVVTTQDSFAWNRARWRAIHAALDEHRAAPEEIDAGFEYNERRLRLPSIGHQLADDRPTVPALDPHYVVAFAPRAGHSVIGRFATGSWLHPSNDLLLLLRD